MKTLMQHQKTPFKHGLRCTKIDPFFVEKIGFYDNWIKYKTVTKAAIFLANKKKLQKFGKVEEHVF